MQNILAVVALLVMADGAFAKGRGGSSHSSSSSSGSHGISDNWDVPAILKVVFYFDIIFAIYGLWILWASIKALKTAASHLRAPFIWVASAAFAFVAGTALHAAYLHVRYPFSSSVDPSTFAAIMFPYFLFYFTFDILLSTGIVVAVQKRATLLGRDTWVNAGWKRILTYTLFTLNVIFVLVWASITTAWTVSENMDPRTLKQLVAAANGLGFTSDAMLVLQYLNAVISSIALYRASKKASQDAVAAKLAKWTSIPLLLRGIQVVVCDIFYSLAAKHLFTNQSTYFVYLLAIVIIQSVLIFWAMMSFLRTANVPANWKREKPASNVPVGNDNGYAWVPTMVQPSQGFYAPVPTNTQQEFTPYNPAPSLHSAYPTQSSHYSYTPPPPPVQPVQPLYANYPPPNYPPNRPAEV